MDLGISALNYVNGIKNNEFTVEEFISESLEHINKVDEKLHAFLRVNDLAAKKAKEIDLNKLRDDKYDPYDKNLLNFLKSYQGKYVKAPKLN